MYLGRPRLDLLHRGTMRAGVCAVPRSGCRRENATATKTLRCEGSSGARVHAF